MERAVLLFSGGRDSFLTAIEMADAGYELNMLVCNNGCTCGLDNIYSSVDRLTKTFTDKTFKVKTVNTSYIFGELRKSVFNIPVETLPAGVTMNQTLCLLCQASMLITGILHCKYNNIVTLAFGYRETEDFYVHSPMSTFKFADIAKEYGIELVLPVYQVEGKDDVKGMLLERGFTPKTYEAQCCISTSVKGRVSTETVQGMSQLFNDVVRQDIIKIINRRLRT